MPRHPGPKKRQVLIRLSESTVQQIELGKGENESIAGHLTTAIEATWKPSGEVFMVFAVYRLFDEDGALLYVGRSCNVTGRLSDHSLQKPWWKDVSSIEIELVHDFEAACRAERSAIQRENPRYNIQRLSARDDGERDSVNGMETDASQKTVVVGIRLNDKTLAWWQNRADLAGLPLSTTIRRSLESRAKKAQEEEATT